MKNVTKQENNDVEAEKTDRLEEKIDILTEQLRDVYMQVRMQKKVIIGLICHLEEKREMVANHDRELETIKLGLRFGGVA